MSANWFRSILAKRGHKFDISQFLFWYHCRAKNASFNFIAKVKNVISKLFLRVMGVVARRDTRRLPGGTRGDFQAGHEETSRRVPVRLQVKVRLQTQWTKNSSFTFCEQKGWIRCLLSHCKSVSPFQHNSRLRPQKIPLRKGGFFNVSVP